MISVIIPLYNKAGLVRRTIESVLAQTYTDYEIVVVDDGSTDGSAAVIEAINDPRIRLISQQNAGVSAARNRGIAEAKSEYIALLDADDEWKPEFLETMIGLAEKHPECDVFAVDYEMHTDTGKVISTIINRLPFSDEDGVLSNYFEVASRSNPPICSISIMVRKGVFESVGGFPLGIRSGEDLLTWARLACRYQIAYSRKSLAVFNIEGYDVKDKPKRIPAEVDVVGQQLKALHAEYHTPGLRQYRSMWHKMRAVIYMRLRIRRPSMREAVRAIALNPLNAKLYAILALNLLPSRLQPF